MNRELFVAIAERLTEPLLLLSPVAVVIACNEAALRAIGPDLEHRDLAARALDPVGFRCYITLASRSITAVPGTAAFVGTGERWRCGANIVEIDGEEIVILHLRPMSETVRRLTALEEQIAGLEAEVGRREELEREHELLLVRAREARADAEGAARFKDELLASISHELRTPLNAISGWLALLRESPADPDLFAHALEVIERNVEAESHLIDDLVDSSLAISGKLRIEPRPVDLQRVAREAIDSVAPTIEAKQQRIELLVESSKCVVKGDRDRLHQVIWNLLSNATKYTPQGGVIQIRLRRIGSQAELTVSDTGVGIAPDLLPHVFDRFRRGDGTTTRHYGGLGLGLALVRHIVELHGGLVTAASEGPGRGATMTVTFPLPVLRSSEVAGSANGGAARPPLTGIRTLLVEDHEDSRELLANILRARGATVTAVDRASPAQHEFRNQAFDVVVSDIEMPGEDGFELMRKLRAIERELDRSPVPAVAVSAHSLGDARGHALSAGYQAFLAKPLKPADLIATVERLCSQQR